MALTAPISTESNLIGRIVTSNVTTTATTVYASFTDSKTGAARTPQATTLCFVFNKDNDRFEIMKCDSHSTASGITTLTVNAAGRAMPLFGIGGGGGTGSAHSIGEQVGCADVHWYSEVLNNIIDGTEGTTGENFKLGNEANNDITFYAWNGDTNEPYIRYDAGNNKWIFSNNGVSSTDVGGGTGTVTAGDGIDIAAGVVSTDLKANSGLEIDTTELAVKAGNGISLDSNGVNIDPTAGFSLPTGAILPYCAAAAPTGFVLCDGASLLRASYAALFAVIGTTYGSVDGTHFNVPDCQGMSLYGKDTAGTYQNMAATGGAETTDSSHTHALGTAGGAQIYFNGAAIDYGATGPAFSYLDRVDVGLNAATGTGNSTALCGATDTGASATLDVKNPFLVVQYILKT